VSETTLRHVEHFTNAIGPRGSATPKEAEAHDYCQATLEGLGYEVHRESFMSPLSGWHPYALAEGGMLLAVAIFWLMSQGADAGAGGLAAAALSLVINISFLLHLMHRSNPLLWFLPVDRSQNVWAVARPSGEERQSVVLSGHVDTHRAALAMQSPGMWQFFQVFTMVAGAANLALLALFVWGALAPNPLARELALIVAIIPAVMLVFTLQPDFAPFVAGANDNATGAAAVLAFAERLKAEPLQYTAVYLVNTGCEEVGCFGMMDWIKRHAEHDAPEADYLVLDNIGGKGSDVNYVLDETLLLPVEADTGLVELAEQVASANSALGAKPFHYRGLYSEMSVASALGQSALGLLDFDPRTKMPPNFHTPRDDMSNIDSAVLERSEQFAWALLQEIDRGAEDITLLDRPQAAARAKAEAAKDEPAHEHSTAAGGDDAEQAAATTTDEPASTPTDG
jgi:hypothetical protein